MLKRSLIAVICTLSLFSLGARETSAHASYSSMALQPSGASSAAQQIPPATPPLTFPRGTYPPTCEGGVPCSAAYLARPRTTPAPPPSSFPLAGPAPGTLYPPQTVAGSASPEESLAGSASPGGRLNDMISLSSPLTDSNAPGCCNGTSGWAYELNAGTSQTAYAFSTDIDPEGGSSYNSVPSSYSAAVDYHWIGAWDSADTTFIQVGYAVDSSGSEYLFAWTNQSNGASCVNGSSSNYNGQGCTASLSTFGVSDGSWKQFWIEASGGTDYLEIGSTVFMERTASGSGYLYNATDTSEVSTTSPYDMQTDLIANGLKLSGYFDDLSYWNGSSYTNESPLTATSSQRDWPPDTYVYNGNYFCGGGTYGPFGQYGIYGSGTGSYEAGDPNNTCVTNNYNLPNS